MQNPVAKAMTGGGVFRGPEGPRFHHDCTEIPLGSCAVTDLERRLISRARLTVDLRALSIRSSIVKELLIAPASRALELFR
jgi:hypothetical protein